MSKNEILVVGATGKTGRRVSARLRVMGERVRPVSRSSAVRFDWSEPDGWDAALTGVSAAYVVAPPVPGPMGEFIERAQAVGLRRLVLLSARSVDTWEGSAFGRDVQDADRAVRESSLDWTIVRPSNFSQVFDEDIFAGPLLRGELALPAEEMTETFVDVEDVAAVVAEVLTNAGHEGQIYELTGPRPLTFAEATALIAAASDRDITYRQVTPEQYSDILVNEGLPRENADAVAAMFDLIGGASGAGAEITDDIQRLLDREASTFEDYVVRTAAAGKWRV